MTSTEDNLDILHLVHKLAVLNWRESAPKVVPQPQTSLSTSSKYSTTNVRISPTAQLTFPTIPQQEHFTSTNNKTSILLTSRSYKDSNNVGVGPAITNNSPGRRINPVSIPRRPPDIQNLALFPQLGGAASPPSSHNPVEVPPQLTAKGRKSGNEKEKTELTPSERKLKKLENKLRGRRETNVLFGTSNNENDGTLSGISAFSSSEIPSSNANTVFPIPTATANMITPVRKATLISSKITEKKAPRSAEIFAELTPEIVAQVDKLASDYSALLDKNMCRSVLEELTFILQIITSSRPLSSGELSGLNLSLGGSGGSGGSGGLNSVAQQIYFVIKVLSLQLDKALINVDPQVILLLVEKYPHRIPKPIRKHFQTWVTQQIQREQEIACLSPEVLTHKPSEFHQCVTFHSETDGRSNFPCQGDFHAFCKQRDLFYSIKNQWSENNYQNTQSEVVMSFSRTSNSKSSSKNNNKITLTNSAEPLFPKIKALFQMNSSWANLSHFASLFVSQFLLDALEEKQKTNEALEGEDEQMKNMQQSNPDRFAKLNSRMSSTSTATTGKENGAPEKDFLAFQKYFLKVAESPAFHQHLSDRIVFEITQIESSLDSSNRLSIVDREILVKKTILLSKFLGYLTFLPYADNGPNPIQIFRIGASLDKEALWNKHLELRKNQSPPLDIIEILKNALIRHRLTFTLPWIIEFLSASDPLSLRLPSYTLILRTICDIYHSLLKYEDSDPASISCLSGILSFANKNFLRFFCGNFFTSDKFPTLLLYETSDEICSFLLNVSPSRKTDDDDESFDSTNAIGEKLIKIYFSRTFDEMKRVLHVGLQQRQLLQDDDSVSLSSKTPSAIKHIRPIPAKSPLKSQPVLEEIHLQRQLESSFFDINSSSVKKTVDFIADRIASNYVKHLRKIMPDQRSEMSMKGVFEEEAASNCRKKMIQEFPSSSKEKCHSAVTLLIGDAVSNAALTICQQIATRIASEKVQDWVNCHIKPELFPEIVIDASDAKEIKSSAATPKVPEGEEEFPINFSSMILLHRIQKKWHKSQPVAVESIDQVLNKTALASCPAFINTLVDFGIALIVHVPHLLTDERQEKLVKLWCKQWNPDCHLLCSRNLLILKNNCSNESVELSWTKLTEIILRLVDCGLMDLSKIEEDCFTILREDLAPQQSKFVSQLLRKIANSKKDGTTENDSRSREIIDWVAWYCSNDQDGEF